MMPGQKGITYAPKGTDHMERVLVRSCPTCGAKIGELCVMKSGKRAIKVTEVHVARFGKRPARVDYYAI